MAVAATLEIQLAADVARLRRDFAEAKSIVGGAIGDMKNAALSLAGVFGVGLSAGYFVSLIKGSIDAADHLHDLSKTTSIAVEQLAGLQLAATQSGGDLDSIAASINKLSVNMGNNADKFAALGISAKNPLEAFKQLADVFVAIQDPQQRAAVMAEALGKSWAGAAPLLAEGGRKIGEMVERGTQLSGTTKEMTDQADKFKDQMAELNITLGATTNKVVGDLLPGMNDIAAAMREAAKEGGLLTTVWVGMGGAAANLFSLTPAQKLREINEQLEIAQKIVNMNVGDPANIRATIDELEKDKARLTELLAPTPKSALPGVDPADAAGAAGRADAFLKAEKLAAEKLANEKKFADERKRLLAEDTQGWVKHAQDVFDTADQENRMLAEISQKHWDEEDRLRKESNAGWVAYAEARIREDEEMNAALAKVNDEANKASNFARDMGLTFSSAFEDAIVGGLQLSEVLRGLGKDILRIIARKTVTEPLGNAITSLLGSALSSFAGSFGGSSGPVQLSGPGMAAGGSVYAGESYLVGERGPELFMPQSSGNIIPNSGMGVTHLHYSPVYHIDSRSDRASIIADIDASSRRSEARIYDNLRRGGSFAKAVGRA